jgi:isopenicillin-N epimerase
MSTSIPKNLKDLFLLNPKVTFLNHGSFGACPRPVFQAYQRWQRKLEWQPVEFIGRELGDHFHTARKILAEYINASEEELAYIPNATYGVNVVTRSLSDSLSCFLKPGDEILTTNQEYGACNYAWEFVCKRNGVNIRQQEITFPIKNKELIVEQIWEGVNERTKIIYLSHITSPTALKLPVEEICQRARSTQILTVIDGAHAPGQLSIDMKTINADFYIGNCHKWMLSPKGSGFIYVRPEWHYLIQPLIVSWGYGNNGKSHLVDYLQWTGTKDPAAMLSVPDAINFMKKHNWEEVRKDCHTLLIQAILRLSDIAEQIPFYPLNNDYFSQMGIAPLRDDTDLNALGNHLYHDKKIIVPIGEYEGRKQMRISIQAYNVQANVDYLVDTLSNFYKQ